MHQLKIRGTPREMGRQHGETFREQIWAYGTVRREVLQKKLAGFTAAEIEQNCLEQVEVLKKHPALYQEFMGIQEGADIPVADLVILNNFTDMREYIKNGHGGCSALGWRDGGEYVCGQTWDMGNGAKPYLLHLEKTTGTRAHFLTITGCLGMLGVNEHGVALFINNLKSHETSIGLMWPALVRGMLEMKTAVAAKDFLAANLPCGGHNYLMCGPDRMINIEATGQRVEVTESKENGCVFHTNHYLGSFKNTELSRDQLNLSSFPRYDEMQTYFGSRAGQALTRKQLAEEVMAGGCTPAVCIVEPDGVDAIVTCGGMILDMNRRIGDVFEGRYSPQTRREIRW